MNPLTISLCSWSLQLDNYDALKQEIHRFGIDGVHLHVGSFITMSEADREKALAPFRASKDLIITATMVGYFGENYTTLATIKETGGLIPDALYPERHKRLIEAAKITKSLGVSVLTTHAGFIPSKKENAAHFDAMVARFRDIADELATLGITLGFETGQETADDLATFLSALQRDNIGANFDPANMVLYGKGNPVDSVIRLAPFLKHMHVKDAKKFLPEPTDPTAWRGLEVAVGDGDAKVSQVIEAAVRCGYRGAVAIEREVGATRGKDIAKAISELKTTFARIP